MINRLCYIILILVLMPFLSSATIKNRHFNLFLTGHYTGPYAALQTRADTIINKKSKKQRDEEEKNKIKEIAKAKKQAKPEKVTDEDEDKNKKRRQRRPEGVERPPEIIRRNGG